MKLVVRRQFWEGPDTSRQEYLTDSGEWTADAASARPYQSSMAFHEAVLNKGAVFLRMPSGREIPVSKSDFLPEDKSN